MQATPIGIAAGIFEDERGGVLFIAGSAAYSWTASDPITRRLAAVHLAQMKLAPRNEVAAAFGVTRITLWQWERALQEGGWARLADTCRRGPNGPSKLSQDLLLSIRLLDQEGLSQRQIAERVGVSTFSVRRALGRVGGPVQEPATAHAAEIEPPAQDESLSGATVEPPAATVEPPAATVEPPAATVEPPAETVEPPAETVTEVDLPALPAPQPRVEERRRARAGDLVEARPVFTQGRDLPLLGLLLVLPALEEVGLLAAAEGVYGRLRNGFYGLRSLLLMLTFQCLLREPRAEGATRLPPLDLGRLLGLDRAPEVKSIRRRLGELAGQGQERAVELLRRLAKEHVRVREGALGFLYLDGHTTVYTGKRRLPKAHITRLRISAPASEDLWVSDAQGDPVFVVAQPPGSSMVKEIRALLPELRRQLGQRRVTICFDRGGWSPQLFGDIIEAGFDFLTYRKGRTEALPAEAFEEMTTEVEGGRQLTFTLADRPVTLRVGGASGAVLRVREVVRQVDEHQTVIVTSRMDLPAVEVAVRMFSRWRQENWFKYGRIHFGLDAMDSYAVIDDDPERPVPNPARSRLQREQKKALSQLTRLQAENGELGLPREQRVALEAAVRETKARIEELELSIRRTPDKVPLREVEPSAQLLSPQGRLISHAVRMSAFNAESALARLLAPSYRRASDEARSLLREAFKVSGDLRQFDHHLEISLNPLSAPRRTAALAALCQALTDTETVYPGTDLVLRYSVKSRESVS